jgi:septal ring factor EnvC (AmiA/AmiB activator)
MPKRRADTIPEGAPAPKLPCEHDQVAGRIHQAKRIINNGFVPSFPCDFYALYSEVCVMDRTRKYSKCASCTRQGRTCKKDFHTAKEWDILKSAEKKIASKLSTTDDKLELLYPELRQLQEHLEKIQKELMEKQQKVAESLARHSRLQKQQKFLKERGFKILEHDAELLRILDEKKSSEQPNPAAEIKQLAVTSENPNFNQMMTEIDQMPPSF